MTICLYRTGINAEWYFCGGLWCQRSERRDGSLNAHWQALLE